MTNGTRVNGVNIRRLSLERRASDVGRGAETRGLRSGHAAALRQQGNFAIPKRSLREIRPISTAMEAYQKAVESWQKIKTWLPIGPRTVGVVMPGTNQIVQLDGRMMEAELRSIPPASREQVLKDMPRILQERINHGFEVWNGVRSGAMTGPARLDDVRDLMTFLMAKAMERGDGFSEGSFNIEDPGHRLKQFLDSCPEGYNRSSSHINGFQRVSGGNHRGIDLRLPYGKHTLLYGAMKKGVLDLEEDRLFLKMEEHGCRLFQSSPKEAPRSRSWYFRDIRETLAHAVGYFKTLLRKLSGGRLFPNARDFRKERIPSDVSRDFKAILRHLDRTGQGACARILRENSPLDKAHGIRTLFINLSRALNRLDLDIDSKTRDMLTRLWDKIAARYDHLNVRIGNEVVLDIQDIEGKTGPQERQIALERSVTALIQTIIGQLLDIPDPNKITEDQVKHFTQEFVKIGVLLHRSGSGPEANAILQNAVKRAMLILSNEQRIKLDNILLKSPIRKPMEFIEVWKNYSRSSSAYRANIADKAASAFMLMCENLGHKKLELLELFNLEGTSDKDKEIAMSVLDYAVEDLYVAEGADAKVKAARIEAMIGDLAEGRLSLADVRRRIGPGIYAIGEYVEKFVWPDLTDGNAIVNAIVKDVRKDLARNDRDTDLSGLSPDFVKDFLRTTVEVNGRSFGGKGSNISQEEKQAELQAFVEAIGDPKKAKQIARFVHQGAFGSLLTAAILDPGLKTLVTKFQTFTGSSVGTEGMKISLHVEGDTVAIHMGSRQRRQRSEDGLELGQYLSLDFTLRGAGSEHPELRLEKFDILFTSRISK